MTSDDTPRDDTAVVEHEVYTLHRGTRPLLVSMPHVGTAIPPDQRWRYSERALQVEDTDWHLDRLYGFVRDLGASLIVPRHSRYLIDLNRPPENTPMYAGRNNTGLIPTTHFTGEPIYQPGREPDAAEVQRRVVRYWRPYHDALRAELDRIVAGHGHAVLFDAHSIKSELPWLFDGTLPHMNVGTAAGASCAPGLRSAVASVFAAHGGDYSHVVDGRFQGGHITRHYGAPQRGVHAVQLEMCWRAYMSEDPAGWNDDRAAEVAPLLRELVQTMLDWRPAR